MTWNRQRTYAALVGIGIWVLLGKTIVMTLGGGLTTFVPWVAALLALEFALNAGVFLSAIVWWCSATARFARLSLRLTAATVIVHAVRVLIYVLSQAGPWRGFDVRPEHRAAPGGEWGWVAFAATMSAISLVGLVIVWRRRRHRAEEPGH